MKRLVVGLVTAAALAGCGSSGAAKSSPTDLFLDSMEAVCRATHSKVLALDETDPKSVGQLHDLVSDADDQMNGLTPPAALKGGFDDFVSNLDSQTTAIDKYAVAVSAGDAAAETAAVAAIGKLTAKGDELAEGVNAIKCIGLTNNGLYFPTTSTATTTGTTGTGTTDTATTTGVTTPTQITLLPATTVPATGTTIGGTTTTLPTDISLGAPPPAEYHWIKDDLLDISGLYAKTHLGPLITFYAGGRVQSDTSAVTAGIFLIRISKQWTDEPDALKEYLFWERVENGTSELTPGGIPVTKMVGAAKDVDCIVFAAGSSGISVCTHTGVDGGPIMDAFVAAQNSGG